jgi:hypothetical protein
MYEFFQNFLWTLLVYMHDMCAINPCIYNSFLKIYCPPRDSLFFSSKVNNFFKLGPWPEGGIGLVLPSRTKDPMQSRRQRQSIVLSPAKEGITVPHPKHAPAGSQSSQILLAIVTSCNLRIVLLHVIKTSSTGSLKRCTGGRTCFWNGRGHRAVVKIWHRWD